MFDLKELFSLQGKSALVTGGAKGLGRACSTALAMAGADVTVAARDAPRAHAFCEHLRRMGSNAAFVRCDVSDPGQIRAMVRETVRQKGRLDIAVNNAGCAAEGDSLTLAKEEWDRVIAVNLTGLFLCAREEARQMSEQEPCGGKVINLASIYGRIVGGNCAYNASKAAVVHLTRTLAAEWGSSNINVNCISPGWVLTPGNQAIPESLRARMRETTPLGSLATSRDVSGAVIYLASHASDFVTGHELVVDGGHSLDTWLTPRPRRCPARVTPRDEEAELRADLPGVYIPGDGP
jgi:NAD(P)-dependent dehydrogenase (short-subunit alcohol dehydrogenase family)